MKIKEGMCYGFDQMFTLEEQPPPRPCAGKDCYWKRNEHLTWETCGCGKLFEPEGYFEDGTLLIDPPKVALTAEQQARLDVYLKRMEQY